MDLYKKKEPKNKKKRDPNSWVELSIEPTVPQAYILGSVVNNAG